MQWNQIKTILIISFLILDVYLLVQFLEKKAEADIGILEQHTDSIENQLADDNISYDSLPDEEYEETFISVEQKVFTEEDLKAENKKIKQTSFILQDHMILSQVDEKIKLNKSDNHEKIREIFNDLVYFSEQYTYWNWNKDENIIIFFQNKFNRPVYYNENGLVLLFLNDKDEIVYYTQTKLGDAEQLAERRELMQPIQAIEILYRSEKLQRDDRINQVNIGFYTRVPFETDEQVFAPIWKVRVNNEADYFVNAIEGFIFSTDEKEFFGEAIESALEKAQSKRRNNKDIETIYSQLEEKAKELLR